MTWEDDWQPGKDDGYPSWLLPFLVGVLTGALSFWGLNVLP